MAKSRITIENKYLKKSKKLNRTKTASTRNMWKGVALLSSVFYILINKSHSSLAENVINTSDECLTNSLETSLYCRGSRAINNIINNLSKTDKPVVIVRGLEIVPSHRPNNNTVNSKTSNSTEQNEVDDETSLARFAHYLRTHELNIKFSDLMSFDESERVVARDIEQPGIQNVMLDGKYMLAILILYLQ